MKTVILEPYNPNWKNIYQQAKRELLTLLQDEIINIYHIGSTSIENMSAKPIIDILIEVKDVNNINNYQNILVKNHYQCLGENGIEKRYYLEKYENDIEILHVHIFSYGNKEIRRHLNFRRYLLEHQDAFNQYLKIKTEAAKLFADHRSKYQMYKDEFCKEIDTKADKLYSNDITPLRKTKKLMSYYQNIELLKQLNYGTLTISSVIPYSIPINYIYHNGALYFHSGLTGYKITGINQIASFNVIHDLGLNPEFTTHNYQSVTIYGKLVSANENRDEIMKLLFKKYAPNSNKINEDYSHTDFCNILKLEIYTMIGKQHIKP